MISPPYETTVELEFLAPSIPEDIVITNDTNRDLFWSVDEESEQFFRFSETEGVIEPNSMEHIEVFAYLATFAGNLADTIMIHVTFGGNTVYHEVIYVEFSALSIRLYYQLHVNEQGLIAIVTYNCLLE